MHEKYVKLGASAEQRYHAYRELFRYRVPAEDVHLIERASHYSHPVGDDRLKQQIEQKYGIKLGHAARGRPNKQVNVVKK